ncbi:MAG: hypothetical protein A2728_01825 [Candidatus Spechtbacteria bacterium RIFCSPHIGHO2_01_FULL_38_11]|nr:MAG: hypothetical protein A2728_01825 [Candidatus Spechtbacteria bacterium RIFCSPHIGHO2_01_FULL_38_11]OGZ59475.1 MAG: hypothetical protein A3E58_00840 [Candidatus Spechtbacteria bacterium RIFCSPHIGHO2_12_FULL_38_30]
MTKYETTYTLYTSTKNAEGKNVVKHLKLLGLFLTLLMDGGGGAHGPGNFEEDVVRRNSWLQKAKELFHKVNSVTGNFSLGIFKGKDLPHLMRVLGQEFEPDNAEQQRSVEYLSQKFGIH